MTIKVEISAALVTQFMTTGASFKGACITKGLPEGAKLTTARVGRTGNIELFFTDRHPGSVTTLPIELETEDS